MKSRRCSWYKFKVTNRKTGKVTYVCERLELPAVMGLTQGVIDAFMYRRCRYKALRTWRRWRKTWNIERVRVPNWRTGHVWRVMADLRKKRKAILAELSRMRA
jgi:hypothetical protein